MRKLIVCNIISVDGFYSGPGDDVMVMPFDAPFDDYNAERLRAADTLLLGRRSFEGFKGYWPSIADNPDAPPVEREISRLDNEIDKVVVSDSLTDADLAPLDQHHHRPEDRRAPRRRQAQGRPRPRDRDVRQPHPVERPAEGRPRG
jgi:hypothetical protein